MIPEKLLNAYYAFCVVFVTVVLTFLVGVVIYIIIDEIRKHIRKKRQARQSRRYLNEVIGHLDKVEETDEGIMVTGTLNDAGVKLVKSGAVTGLSIGYDLPTIGPFTPEEYASRDHEA